MNILVFDTETTSLEKPFCYNIGFCVYDTERQETIFEKEYVIEQIWHNKPLFSSAYYADKRPIYVERMRARKIKLEKFGYVTQRMTRVIKDYDVQIAFAYNSSFDEKVFNFNCDWFKCINPFDNIPIYDIRGHVHHFIAFTKEYQSFCDTHKLFTESGNYSTTAEDVFRFFDSPDFVEEHTALADSQIELEVLKRCVALGASWTENYKTYRSIPRKIKKVLTVNHEPTETSIKFEFEKMRWSENKTVLNLK